MKERNNMDALKAAFQNPPALYRPAPLWVWNDLMTMPQIEYQLKEMASHGFGGAFVHPRPGLVTEYLSEEWFELWGYALEVAKKLGMKLYIYDENSFPSGFAGGFVPSALPDCLATGAGYRVIGGIGEMPIKKIVRAYTCVEDNNKVVIQKDITATAACDWEKEGGRFFVVTLERPVANGWLAGFALPDFMRPEVTAEFLKTTHEQYYSHFGGDFGDGVPALFTDEPTICNIGLAFGSAYSVLPFSYWLAGEFQKQHGYSLLDNLPCIFKNVGGDFEYPPEKVRYDYYTTMHTLWSKNAVEPTSRWCADHNIAWTGHYLEHQWPFAYANDLSPSVQSHYEFHQWPGIDMLMTNYLRDSEAHSLALTIQEVRSAANQFEKERTICELYGGGGWDSTFEDYKRMADWVLVNGINFINQCLVFATIAGARKRDAPQSFDWRQPWWNEYSLMNDYLGRASFMLSSGKMRQRILVINPSTTGYLIPFQEELGSLHNIPGTDAIKNPDMRMHLEMVQSLCDNQWDFDFGDEYTMQRNAGVSNMRFVLGAQSYDVLIISCDTKNLMASTVGLLKRFAAAGGRIVAVGTPGDYVDGVRRPEVFAELEPLWTKTGSLDSLQELLRALLPERIQSVEPWARGVTHMRRELDDGREIYFFVNHHFGNFTTRLTLAGKSVTRWNLYTGETEAVDFTTEGGNVSFMLSLERNQSVMFIINDYACEKAGIESAVLKQATLVLASVYAESPNMFTMEYCDLALDGKTYESISVLNGCDKIFERRGFDGNPWDTNVQFRNSIMSRNRFGPGSGFEAAFHFNVADGFRPLSLHAVAEHPSICRLSINGSSVPWLTNEYCIDGHFGVAEIAPYIADGKNILTIAVDAFDVRMELEPVYLRGDFAVKTVDGRWMLAPPEKLRIGDWIEQGLPFYSGAVSYVFTANLDRAPGTALLDVARFSATALSVTVNGKKAGLINADGVRPAELAPLLKAGENEIAIRASGNFKNLMGPHFIESPIIGLVGAGYWKSAPAFFDPKASHYDLLPMGLFEAPILMIGDYCLNKEM